jgi:predicted ester cyclase
MSTEENKAVIRRFIAAFESHNLDAIWENLDPNCRFPVLARFGIEPTLENYQRFTISFLKALPDVHHTIEGMVAEGEQVWVRYTISGTHEGLLRNVPATHKSISYELIGMYRVANNRLVEADFLSDDLNLLRQLGTLPS